MIGALTWLLAFQLVGEVVTHGLHLPVPGPVLGMALLFLTLVIRGGVPDSLRQTANQLLQHLSLLFVPAGVGVMLHFQRLADEWPALLLAVLGSTLLTMAVSGLLLKWLVRGKSKSS